MNLLALDTSSDACSVALQIGDKVFEKHVVQAKEHTNILIPMIQELLHDAGVGLQDMDAIVLGNGPGSFIGMRIAASASQGLAFGSALKIVPVSSMAAVAAEVMDTHAATTVVVAQDARMNEVYLGTYRRDADGLPVVVTAETLQPIEQTDKIGGAGDSEIVAAGNGWQKYPVLLELNSAAIAEVVDVHYPRARYLLELAVRGWQCGEAVDPENLVPAYIRSKVAEIPREATEPQKTE